MSCFWRNAIHGFALVGLLLVVVEPAHSEYMRIQLKVYGLDCELCARGVSATIEKMPGVKSVDVSLKKGMLDIVLIPGNTFKITDLRKRIRENGFRSMEATVTAVGEFNGNKFEVLGSGESYDIGGPGSNAHTPVEVTFDVR